jgi:hypothetical protein
LEINASPEWFVRRDRESLRGWLWKNHAKTQAQYEDAYSNEGLDDHDGLVNFPMHTKWQTT